MVVMVKVIVMMMMMRRRRRKGFESNSPMIIRMRIVENLSGIPGVIAEISTAYLQIMSWGHYCQNSSRNT
jgi:hypothetical protein